MKKEDTYSLDSFLESRVSHFLNHLDDYSNEQTTEFLKSVYAASQERIAKGKSLVANDDYPDEEDLDKAIGKFLE